MKSVEFVRKAKQLEEENERYRKRVPAECACGRIGKSRSPDRYVCSFCRGTSDAEQLERLADALHKRLKGCRKLAAAARKKAATFDARHPLPRKPRNRR